MAWLTLFAAVIAAVAYARGVAALRAGGRRAPSRWAVVAFAVGLLALVVALSPWIEHRAESDLGWHMGQHVLLWMVAAPLLVAGSPVGPLTEALGPASVKVRRAVPRGLWRLRTTLGSPAGLVWAWFLSTATLWAWHLPVLYEAAVRNEVLHALEHLSFLGTATLFWGAVAVAARRAAGFGPALLCLLLSSAQAAALGALLTFSAAPWYASYPSLTEQQLAGVVMWIPGGLVYLTVAAGLFLRWLGAEEGSPERPPHRSVYR